MPSQLSPESLPVISCIPVPRPAVASPSSCPSCARLPLPGSSRRVPCHRWAGPLLKRISSPEPWENSLFGMGLCERQHCLSRVMRQAKPRLAGFIPSSRSSQRKWARVLLGSSSGLTGRGIRRIQGRHPARMASIEVFQSKHIGKITHWFVFIKKNILIIKLY